MKKLRRVLSSKKFNPIETPYPFDLVLPHRIVAKWSWQFIRYEQKEIAKRERMQRSSRAEEIILKLRKIEISVNQGKSIRLSCREAGVSEHTYYKWRREYGGLNIDWARELKELKEENLRLKKVVADLTLDKLILNEALAIEGKQSPKYYSHFTFKSYSEELAKPEAKDKGKALFMLF